MLLCGATSPLGLADAAAVPVVAVGWSFQEWAIHKYLLHGLEVKRETTTISHKPCACVETLVFLSLGYPQVPAARAEVKRETTRISRVHSQKLYYFSRSTSVFCGAKYTCIADLSHYN